MNQITIPFSQYLYLLKKDRLETIDVDINSDLFKNKANRGKVIRVIRNPSNTSLGSKINLKITGNNNNSDNDNGYNFILLNSTKENINLQFSDNLHASAIKRLPVGAKAFVIYIGNSYYVTRIDYIGYDNLDMYNYSNLNSLPSFQSDDEVVTLSSYNNGTRTNNYLLISLGAVGKFTLAPFLSNERVVCEYITDTGFVDSFISIKTNDLVVPNYLVFTLNNSNAFINQNASRQTGRQKYLREVRTVALKPL